MPMKGEYTVGINYWPINTGMNFWRSFDKGEISEDFSKIKEADLNVIRVFLLWEDFQPLPAKLSTKTIDRLITVMEIANDVRVKILPTLFTGHMSGVNYIPPWLLDFGEENTCFPVISEGKKRKNRIRNFYSDRELRERQRLFIREISNALKGHPSLWAWDLGNEPSNVVQPLSKEEGIRWLEEMVSELKRVDESIPVTIGLHIKDLEEDRNMGPKEASRFCDFLSIHTYSVYAKWGDHLLDEDIVPFLAMITNWLGQKDVLIEEVGIPSSNTYKNDVVVSEEEAHNYYERLLKKLKHYPFLGVLFWCYGDYESSLWDSPPLDENPHERFFGLFRANKSPKPFINLINILREENKKKPLKYDWIDIEPSDYYKEPLDNLKRLYRRFKECQG